MWSIDIVPLSDRLFAICLPFRSVAWKCLTPFKNTVNHCNILFTMYKFIVFKSSYRKTKFSLRDKTTYGWKGPICI
jgi:hypothetical protein